MNDTLEQFKKQHIENYRKAILENIRNNTTVLVDEDIMSLLKKPPLDSMDVIKTKFLDLAKKGKVILNTDELDNMLEVYRKDVIKCCDEIKNIRIEELSEKVESITLEKNMDIIKLNKKDFSDINKKIKKIVKDQIKNSVENKIVKNVNKLFTKNIDVDCEKKLTKELIKFVNGSYQRQLLENVDIKVLVKDTTLMNGVKEQAERYLFTLENSRLFKEDNKWKEAQFYASFFLK